MRFLDLNTDCLLRIFSFCDENDLINLSRCHFVLDEIIENNVFHSRTLNSLMTGHRNVNNVLPSIFYRTHPLSFASRLKIARNWLNGCYREQQYFDRFKMFPTKLALERDFLYVSHAYSLCRHKRLKAEPLSRQYKEIGTDNKADISYFVKKRDTIFAGRVTGSCFIFENGFTTEQQLHNPKEYMWCVDFDKDVYATSTDQCGKLWRRSEEFGLLHLDLLTELKSSYKTMQFNNYGNLLYGGLYTSTIERRALREIDLESGYESVLNSNTISIYDLKLKDDNVLFTANFDSSFRLYDRRSNKDEVIWEDPFDSSFYCLEYDGLYAVVCGTKYHSRVNLYDIRVPGRHMQLYFPQSKRKKRGGWKSSPVYSLTCDSRYLFVATDHNVHVLDFKVDCAVSKDFSNVFRQTDFV